MLIHTVMHIPDGFLSAGVSGFFWLLSIVFIGIALRKANRDLGEREVPVMGVLAAAIFAGQMLNFAVTGGTSGHLMGAALAAILVGPWSAILVMTSVVAVQALVFQDGGLLVLGANLFNMGVIGSFVGYFVYRLVLAVSGRFAGSGRWGVFAGGFAAGWASIFIASLGVALQLSASGISPANIAVPAMGGIHALIGIGEGLITLGALSFIYAARRDLLKLGQPQPGGTRAVWAGGALITLALLVLSPLASANPDGLEWAAEEIGFLQLAQAPSYNLIPDYVLPGISNEATATILAGVFGAVIVLGVTVLLAFTRRVRAGEVTGD
jgi:cobalt/nickel transport system permease protein